MSIVVVSHHLITIVLRPMRSARTPPDAVRHDREREARDLGVSKRQLYRWRDDGAIEMLSRGLYRRLSASLVDTDLIEIAHRAPEATLCPTSALVRHGFE